MSATELSEHATKLILPDFSDPGDPKFEPGYRSQNASSVTSHSQHSSSNLIHPDPSYSQSSWHASVPNTIDLISDSESESDVEIIGFKTTTNGEWHSECISLLSSDSESSGSEGHQTTTIKREEHKAQHKHKQILQQYMKDMTKEDQVELFGIVKSMQMEPDTVHSTQSITFAHRLIMILVYILQTTNMDKGDHDMPQVLVISPRRHASSKIATCLENCLDNPRMVSLITGGISPTNVAPRIISATPGKLLHQLSTTTPTINLKRIKTIIIESCDTMTRSKNIRSQMDEIAKYLPKRKIRCLEFNATWEEEEEEKEDVSKIHYSNWESDIAYVREMKHFEYICEDQNKMENMMRILCDENVKKNNAKIIILFARKDELRSVDLDVFTNAGIDTYELDGDTHVIQREKVLQRFTDSQSNNNFLFTTDLISGSCDLKSDMVLNFSIYDWKSYIERCTLVNESGVICNMNLERNVMERCTKERIKMRGFDEMMRYWRRAKRNTTDMDAPNGEREVRKSRSRERERKRSRDREGHKDSYRTRRRRKRHYHDRYDRNYSTNH